MRRAARGLARLILLPAFLPAAAASAEEAPLPDVVSVLSRTAIVVHDLEASKRFYTYALGYRVSFDGDITRPIIATQLGLAEGQRAWFTVLESSNEIAGRKRDGAMIGLLRIANPEPPRLARPAGHDLAVGEAMLAVRTTDIATVHARLKELGARILLEPLRSPDGSQVELVVHDPDGIRIHVVERSDPAP